MKMEIVRLADAKTYTAPGHEQIVARRLQGDGASTVAFAVVGHSTIPDGAVIPMAAGTIDKLYIVVDGTLAVDAADGMIHTLGRGDSIFIPAGEARRVRNVCGAVAAMIVVTPPTS